MHTIFLPERLLGKGMPAVYATRESGHIEAIPPKLLGRSMPAMDFGLEDDSGLRDSYAFSDTFALVQQIGWADSFIFSSAFAYTGLQDTYSISDEFVFSDSFGTQLNLSLADAFAFSDTITIDEFLLALADAYGMSDSFIPAIQATLALSDSWGWADSIVNSLTLGIADAFALADSFVNAVQVLVSLSDSFAMTDTFSTQATFIVSLSDSFGLSDTEPVPTLEVLLGLADSFSIAGAFSLSDEEKYLAWAVNTATMGPYKFSNYPFNSFANVHGKVIACASNGVFELGGDDDDGESIGALLKTGLMDFGTDLKKSLSEAYLAYTADGETLFKVIFSDGGDKTEVWYKLNRRTANVTRQSELPIHRGIEAVHFQFELRPLDGKPQRIKQLTLIPLVTRRML